MTDQNDNARYEFSAHDNQVLLTLSRGLYRLGRLVFVAGLLFVIYLIVAYLDPASVVQISETRSMVLNAVDYGLWVIIALLIIYLSVAVLHLAAPIRLIVETTGADITNLMHFLGDFSRLVRICFVTLAVVCVLMTISLFLLILVF